MEPLRIAVLLDALDGEPWVRDALLEIRGGGLGVFPLVLLGAAGARARTCLLLRCYRALDRMLHRERFRAARPTDLRDTLSGAETLDLDDHARDAELLGRLAAFDLDLVLDLGSGASAARLEQAARHGVWSCAFGDTADRDAAAALLRDLLEDEPAPALAVAVRARGAHREQAHGLRPASVWLSTHLEAAGAKARQCLVRSVRRLALDRTNARRDPETPPAAYAALRTKAPGNLDLLRFAGRSARGLFRTKWRQRTKEVQWLLACRRDSARFVANSAVPDRSGFENIVPPRDRMYADPFLFTHQGADHLFFEDWDCRIERASISVTTFDHDGGRGPVRTALARDHHLSYPFLFEWEDEVFLLPESSEIGVLRLYRARRFPTEWEPCGDLLTGHEIVDATLHAHEGRWYLFANVMEPGGSLKDDLFLFHADGPLGPWHPHARNPIRSDIRCSRPAGRLFLRDGRLIRPAQDSSTGYGSAIHLCEVEVLSEHEYRERIVERIEPTWDAELEGIHTLTFTERLEVVDVKRTIPRRRT